MPISNQLPLAGIRVLELGNFIAAPTATRLLADFGAEVIKVERPGTGDELRRWRLHEGDTSMLFHVTNRNKKSVTLDLAMPRGQEAVRRLVTRCDVLVENFRPGVLERWGLSPDDLRVINPELVVARISGFGQTGPMSASPGFAAVAEAAGGMRALVGDPDRPPSRVGVSIGDTVAGLYAAFGVVMTLLARTRGTPSAELPTVDVALSEAVLSVMESLVPDFDAFGVLRERAGGRIEGVAPSNAYPCADGGDVIVAGNSLSTFRRLMHVIGRDDLSDDPALRDPAERWSRRDELDEAIVSWSSTHGTEEVLVILDAADVPAGRVSTAADIVKDPQFHARNMIQHFDVDTGALVREQVGFPGVVPALDGVSVDIRTLGPRLGEHNEEVFSELLGMTSYEVTEVLRRRTEPAA